MRFGNKFGKMPRLLRPERDELGGGGGGGEGAGGGESGIEAAAPAEPGINIEEVSADIGTSLFGGEKKNDPGNGDLGGGGERGAAPPPAPKPSEAVAPQPPAPGPAAPTPPAPPASQPPVNVDLTKAPTTWKPEAAALWPQMPAALQQEVHRREQDMWKGIAQYRGAANLASELVQALGPLADEAQRAGIHPKQVVNQLAGVHYQLADQTKPAAERLGLAQKLLKSYGLELPAGTPGQEPPEVPYTDPEVVRLREEMQAVQTHLTREQQAQAARIREENERELDAFIADPAHPYFKDVADEMVAFLHANPKMSLKDAYDRAVHANPVTRQKEQDRLFAERQAAADKAEKERVAAAKRTAANNVKPGKHGGGETAAEGSIDDTLQETMRKIRLREKR
jgi:hypothetical protein